MLIAAVAVDDEYLLAAIARHFVSGLLQELELKLEAVGDSSGFVARFKDLSEVILREHHRIFLFGGGQADVPDVNEVGAQREVWSVLFQDAEGKQAGALRALDSLRKIWRRKFFPLHQRLVLCLHGGADQH